MLIIFFVAIRIVLFGIYLFLTKRIPLLNIIFLIGISLLLKNDVLLFSVCLELINSFLFIRNFSYDRINYLFNKLDIISFDELKELDILVDGVDMEVDSKNVKDFDIQKISSTENVRNIKVKYHDNLIKYRIRTDSLLHLFNLKQTTNYDILISQMKKENVEYAIDYVKYYEINNKKFLLLLMKNELVYFIWNLLIGRLPKVLKKNITYSMIMKAFRDFDYHNLQHAYKSEVQRKRYKLIFLDKELRQIRNLLKRQMDNLSFQVLFVYFSHLSQIKNKFYFEWKGKNCKRIYF